MTGRWSRLIVTVGLQLPLIFWAAPLPENVSAGDLPPGGVLSATDPFVQRAKLLAYDAAAGDWFGSSVAISGDTAVVGTPFAVYVFERLHGGSDNWAPSKKLSYRDLDPDFGTAVAISGDFIVVGAPGKNIVIKAVDPGAAQVSGRNEGGRTTWAMDSGAAYIFGRNEGGTDNWGLVRTLLSSDLEAGDFFGGSVAISGDLVIIGATGEHRGIGEPPWDGRRAGAAYVFWRNQGGLNKWGEVKKLVAGPRGSHDEFGRSVAVSGGIAIVGSWCGETCYYGDSTIAALFRRNQGGENNWGGIPVTLYDNWYGIPLTVAISGDTALTGDSGALCGGNPPCAADAHVWERDLGGPDTWAEASKLLASEGSDAGTPKVAISGNTAIVGMNTTGINGLSKVGSVVIFQRNLGGPNVWGESMLIAASDGQADDRFGSSLAISGDTIIVGAPFEDAAGNNAGAAYIFDSRIRRSLFIGDPEPGKNLTERDPQ